jgi:GDPmannose 4,6-dehydratase
MKYLVTGVNGQDGSFFAEQMLLRGNEVVGVGRQSESRWVPVQQNFQYVSVDLADSSNFGRALEVNAPDGIFLAAATHGPSGFLYETRFRDALVVNTLLAQEALEYARLVNPRVQILYLSSSKVFARNGSTVISENSPRVSSCLYSLSKNCATDLVHYYRRVYKIRASVYWLFNHESYRRPIDYFIPKLASAIARALSGDTRPTQFDKLDFYCDWGSASEFMRAIADLAEREVTGDFVIATGRNTLARDLVADLFTEFQLGKDSYPASTGSSDPEPREELQADVSRLHAQLGWVPARPIKDEIVEILKRNYPEEYRKRPPVNNRQRR